MDRFSVNLLVDLAAIAAFILLQTSLSKAAQPLRLEMAEKGEFLLSDAKVQPEFKKFVRFALGTAFGMRAVMLVSTVVVPLYGVVLAVYPRAFEPFVLNQKKLSLENREIFREFRNAHIIVTFANHPILMSALLVEMFFIFVIVLLVRAFFTGMILGPAFADPESIIVEGSTKISKLTKYWHFRHAT